VSSLAAPARSAAAPARAPRVRELGLAPYLGTLQAMQAFTAQRDAQTDDELWVLQHPPTYTYGVAGRVEHLPRSMRDIELVKVDRGGQITYHGPGQIVAYTLLDLRRLGLGVKGLVQRLEQAVLDLLADYDIEGERHAGAPGVYVQGAKIAALGLRITRGASYHGIALNVDMNLEPFARINPCGYPGLAVTQLSALASRIDRAVIAERLLQALAENLGLSRRVMM